MNESTQPKELSLFTKFYIIWTLGFSLTALIVFPGYLDHEHTSWIGVQAKSGVFNNWHALGLTILWYFSEHLGQGHAGLVIADAALLWLGIACVFAVYAKRLSIAYLLSFCVGFAPITIVLVTHIIKDSMIVCFMAAAIGLATVANQPHVSKNKRYALIAIAILFNAYAIFTRYNALFAAIPIMFFHASALKMKYFRRSILFVIALTVGIPAALQKFIPQEEAYPAQQVMAYDLVGISVNSGQNMLPFLSNPEPRYQPLTIEELRGIYQPYNNFNVFWGPENIRRPGFISSPEHYEDLKSYWITAMIDYPIAYLKHRWDVFLHGVGYKQFQYSVIIEESIFEKFGVAPATYGIFSKSIKFTNTLDWMRPWILLLVSTFLVVFAVAKRFPNRGTLLVILASAWGHIFSHLVIGVSEWTRYQYWIFICFIFIIGMMTQYSIDTALDFLNFRKIKLKIESSIRASFIKH